MRSLPLPAVSSASAYNASVGTISDSTRRTFFANASADVELLCDRFDSLATNSQLGNAVPGDFVIPGVTSLEMKSLYDQQFAQRVGTEAIRNSIKNSSPNGICPYCGQGTVYQLDHYLPKSLFAATTVHPPNLVPSCGDCNFEKRDYLPSTVDSAVLHPYFDDISGIRWLLATIVRDPSGVPVAHFHVDTDVCSSELASRLRTHLQVFKLHARFSQWAAQVLFDFEMHQNSSYAGTMTLNESRERLLFLADLHAGGLRNAWERATYEAMAESDWYLSTHLGLS